MQPATRAAMLSVLLACITTSAALLADNSAAGNALDSAQIVCAKQLNTHANFNERFVEGDTDEEAPPPPPLIADEGGIERCENENSHCFTFWTEDPTNGTINIIRQGCWMTSGDAHDCQSRCISRALDSQKFCCCMGNMCNLNFTHIPVQESSASPPAAERLPTNSMLPYIWVAASITVILLLAFPVCVWRLRPAKFDLEMGAQGQTMPAPEYNLNKLCLFEMIGQGRYGSVWRGAVDDQSVAVKIFPAHHRNYFLNEHELYKEAGDSVALVKCFGGGERCAAPNSIAADYLLILSLEQECLQDYLKKHTLDLPTLCKMSLGVAKGLAHLHSDLGKACIAHRDVNTRNILVRADLTCCICDLGLAVIPRVTENRSLSEAGTLRYMAPEVLEGAVNLRDCESALKQIDVYALGLVLWELGVRCTDLQNAEPAMYAPPFHREIGDSPSLEQMQTLVSRHKARPLWPASWKDTPPARLLAETAEDCWDQDAEARLTSLCVEERVLDLPTLKQRSSYIHHAPAASPAQLLINNNHLRDAIIDASVGTIETLLSPSSDDYCKNSNQHATCVIPLQPYQGRNPCMERNLLTGSSDSLLIDKSFKHCSTSESQHLIANDFFNTQVSQSHNVRAMPIPYLQNAVHEMRYAMPKHNNTDAHVSRSKFKWSGLKKIFKAGVERKDTQVSIVPGKLVNGHAAAITTSILNEQQQQQHRPSTLPLLPARPEATTTAGISQLLAHDDNLTRQRSLEHFAEVFSSTSDLSRRKNPAERVKTPGDVPPSVRRTRGKAAKDSVTRFSLYDDRMMVSGQWGSAPDLDPAFMPMKPPQLHQVQDNGSISSF